MKRLSLLFVLLLPLLAMAKGGNDPRLVIITIDGLRWQNTIWAWFARWLQDDPTWWQSMYPDKEL